MVEIDQPAGVSVADVRAYVEDAVASWCGQFQPPGMGPGGDDPEEPGDPRWGIGDTVKIKRLVKPRQKPATCLKCGCKLDDRFAVLCMPCAASEVPADV